MICLVLLRICFRTISRTTAKLASYRHYYSEGYRTKCGWLGLRRCRRTRYGYINVVAFTCLIKCVTQLLSVVKTSSRYCTQQILLGKMLMNAVPLCKLLTVINCHKKL